MLIERAGLVVSIMVNIKKSGFNPTCICVFGAVLFFYTDNSEKLLLTLYIEGMCSCVCKIKRTVNLFVYDLDGVVGF